MYLIKENYYLDLEPFVDMAGLDAMYNDIVLGIVKSQQAGYIKDSGADFENFLIKTNQSIVNSANPFLIRDPSIPFYEYYKELNFDMNACRIFNKYAMDLSAMGQLLILRGHGIKDVHHKHLEEHNYDYPAFKFFPKLKEWVDHLKIFDSIGRVIFWFNAANEPGSIHKDTFLGYPDNFLLVNMKPNRKQLFVVDTDTSEHKELVIPSRAYVFDTRNYHGTRGGDFSGFTFRIDGVFNKNWAESIGVWDFFNPENYK